MAELVSGRNCLSPKMRAMRERGKEDFHFFANEILGYGKGPYNLESQTGMHRDMDAWLQEVFNDPRMFQVMLDFRGSGKSLKGGVSHALWRGIRNPNITIRYMHADEDMASEIMSQMRGHLEGNEKFRLLYADEIFQTKDDDTQKLVVDNESFTLNRSYAPLTPTIRMLGYKSGKIGTHVDLFVLDDLVNEKTTQSPLLMESVRHFITLLPPLLNSQERSKVLVLGTRWDLNDAYGMLLESDEFKSETRPWVFSCYADDQETVSRWPEKFSVETLRRMEVKMTTPFFSANMRNEPIPRGTTLFDPGKVNRYDLELDDQMRPKLPSHLPYLVYVAVDPNRTQHGDNGAVLTVARDADNNHFVLDLDYGRPESTELVMWIRMAAQRWHPIAVLYEASCGQGMLLPWLKRDMLESGVVYPLQESNRKQTVQTKQVRIRGLAQVINTGKLWVPQSAKMKPLMREIEIYTGVENKNRSNDDCLDCLADIFADGFSPVGRNKKNDDDVASPWQTGTMDAMIGFGMGHRPKITSLESSPFPQTRRMSLTQ